MIYRILYRVVLLFLHLHKAQFQRSLASENLNHDLQLLLLFVDLFNNAAKTVEWTINNGNCFSHDKRNVHLFSLLSQLVKFAPKKDHNPTEKYIHEVSEYMGVARNQKIDLNNNNTMLDLLNAMVRMETGRDLPDTLVKKGIELARGTDKRDTEIAITRKDAKKEKV